MTLLGRHCDLLEARGLDLDVLDRLGVESSDKLGPDTIAIPYLRGEQVVGIKYRTIAGEKRFLQRQGSEQILYNRNCLTDETLAGYPLIVTEGEVDCWTAIQCGYPRTVSVPGGAPSIAVGERAGAKYDFIADMPPISDDTVVIIAADGDEPGAALRADLSLRFGSRRCKWLRYPQGCKDLNDALQKFGPRGVVASINGAQWIVGNVYRMSDIPPVPYATPYPSGFPGLEDRWRLRLGDLTIVTGVPSSGKSTFIGDIACRMVQRFQWPCCFASFEQNPTTDHRRALRSWYGGGTVSGMDAETLERADQWINQYFSFVVPDPESYPTFAWVMERFAAAALRYGTRLFVLDPWNELEHDRPDNLSLTEYVGTALRDIKAFARKYEAHFIVAAHPAKLRKEDGKMPVPTLYDIADSAMWANKADVGIIVHRNTETETLIRVAKSRYHSEIGRPGDAIARFVWQRSTYVPMGED